MDEQALNSLKEGIESWQRWRLNHSDRVVFSAIDLQNAYLSHEDLSQFDLRGVNLSGANLSKAILRNANLYEVNLSQADLSGADLSRADLRRANLSYACLVKANFKNAQIWQANFQGATLILTEELPEKLREEINYMELKLKQLELEKKLELSRPIVRWTRQTFVLATKQNLLYLLAALIFIVFSGLLWISLGKSQTQISINYEVGTIIGGILIGGAAIIATQSYLRRSYLSNERRS